jgi:hypothetical protein
MLGNAPFLVDRPRIKSGDGNFEAFAMGGFTVRHLGTM